MTDERTDTVASTEEVAPPRPPPARSVPRSEPSIASTPLRDLLRTPGAVRRAVVLREILGPPVALREPHVDHPFT